MENESANDGSSSKKRAHSPSSASSNSDSDSSNMEDNEPEQYKARKDAQTVSYAHFQFLSQQVQYLTHLITTNNKLANNGNPGRKDETAASNDLDLRLPIGEIQNNQLNIFSEVGTTVKDPAYAKANEKFLTKLTELQRFKCEDWYAVRFSDAQKKYLATPGFIELKVNDELKRFEAAMLKDDPRSYLLERSFAALTNALLCQKDELQNTLQSLVDWASASKESLTSISLFEKIETLFSKQSAYSSV